MKFPAAILTVALLGAVATLQAAEPPAHHASRRRKPAPDPEKEALQKKLAEATAAGAALDSRVLELMSENASLRQALAESTAGSAALRQKLDAAAQSAASLQARLKTAEDRAAQLAAERDKARAAAAPAAKPPSAEEARLEAQLQDINRRRDGFIASVLRRYRELANEYRSFGTAFTVPNDRDLPSKAGPELTRIQNTIAQAEEDLRQLNGLEAQAALVRKAQSKARTP